MVRQGSYRPRKSENSVLVRESQAGILKFARSLVLHEYLLMVIENKDKRFPGDP